jgi:hypothetical protein
MKILINGDSNMAGAELEDVSLSIGSQVCKMYNANEINIALSGASNDRIYNTTIDYCNIDPDIDFVLIGWSDSYRAQWFIDDFGRPEFKEVNTLGIGVLPTRYTKRKEHWYNSSTVFERRIGLSHYWHERIYNLHKYLEYHKIPHLFFNGFHDFMVSDNQYHLDWNQRFFFPYDPHLAYTRWSALQGYKEITPGQYHYEPAAQKVWAEMLYNHIEEHNLRKKL